MQFNKSEENINKRVQNIRFLLSDVDGVLTDGSINIGPDGETLKTFNAKDGVAVALLQKHDIKVGVRFFISEKNLISFFRN